jgi:mono/diheme cytochrome c family protein
MKLQIQILILLLFSVALFAGNEDPVNKGKRIYERSCVVCHGISGKGDGVVAGNLTVKPRNFTDGKFKVRSTTTGHVPLDTDLYRTISHGMGADNAMPAWASMRTEDKEAVIQYIKTFAPKYFARQDRVRVIPT